MAHAFRLQGDLHEVWLSRTPRGYELHLGERRIAVALRDRGEHVHELLLGDRSLPVFVAVRGDEVHVHVEGAAHTLTFVHSVERFAAEAQGSSDAVSRAPMPGAVISISVRPGQRVTRGDVLMVIESMKMETAICAALDGEVQAVHVQQGQTFERDALLVTLSPGRATA
jgi:biotin carboxyl carrier protein